MADRQEGGARPGPIRPGANATVFTRNRIRDRRRISRELDQLCGIEPREGVEPDWSQFALGWNERRAAA